MIWFVLWLVPKIALTPPVRDYADVTMQVDAQKLTVVEVRRGRFDKPTALPRYRGRFVARAMSGSKILEEVRTDLPLLANAESEDVSDEARKFAENLRKGVSVRGRLRVPLPDGTDAIVVLDSKSGRSQRVSLATAPSPAPASGAGAPPAR